MIQKGVEKCFFFLIKISIFLNKKQFLNSLKTLRILLLLFLLNLQYFQMFSAILIKWQKNKKKNRKTFGRPKFRTEKFSDKKKSESFSVRTFSFLMYCMLFIYGRPPSLQNSAFTFISASVLRRIL